MMDKIDNLLKKKAEDIDLGGRIGESQLAAKELARFYPKKCASIEKLDKQLITIRVSASPLASEIRMQQVVILESISRAIGRPLSKLHIKSY